MEREVIWTSSVIAFSKTPLKEPLDTTRGNKGKPDLFMNKNERFAIGTKLTLSKTIKGALVGDMLGDGHLRQISPSTKTRPFGTAQLAFTFSTANYPLITYLRYKIYYSLCTKTGLIPYPNLSLPQHIGKKITQYTFTTKCIKPLARFRARWYNGKIKVLPSD